jgi:hypothetical protein
MDHNEPGSFSGSSASTPDGPEDGPYSADDDEYDTYLSDWLRRVDAGMVDDTMEALWTTIS